MGAVGLINPTKLLADNSIEHLCIMHTNDVHSHIEPFPNTHPKYPGMGGVAKRANLIHNIRSEVEHTLLFDAGDMFQGTPYFNYYAGELEFKLMNAMRYDAATIGNHDFDNGINGLARQVKKARFKILTANYNFENTALSGLTKPYHIFSKGNFKIGVFGLGVELDGLVDPKMYGKTLYLDPIKKAQSLANNLKNNQGCNLVICLSHLGLQYDSNKVSDYVIAEQCSDIDIIIGGHTHSFLEKPIEFNSKSGGKTYISQVGWAGLRLGRIDVYLKKNTTILIYNSLYLNI